MSTALKNRLGKLETPAVEQWQKTWMQYFQAVGPHIQDRLDPLQEVCKEGTRLGMLETVPECRAALDAFCARLDIPTWTTSWGWGEAPDFDIDRPDLTLWPERALEPPPPETVGAWERAEPYANSADIVERFCAVTVLFTLAHARGHRAYLKALEP